jgi:soluble lytic murein transglycosylase-like protein
VAPLKLAFAALALGISAPDRAESVTDWRPYISEASLRFGVPIAWIERVMRVESGGNTTLAGRPIRSQAGAIGLMQLMPGTWEMMRATLALGSSPDNPRDNILAGAFYLRMMYDRFGYPGMFAAYNAGPGRFAAYLARGKGLPAETIAYLRKVDPATFEMPSETRNRAGEALFAFDATASRELPRVPSEPVRSTLFVVQNDAR